MRLVYLAALLLVVLWMSGPSATAATLTHSIGYIGCSNTMQAVDGYHGVKGNYDQLWDTTGYDLGGGSMDQWVSPTATYWTSLDSAIAKYGQPQKVWIEQCVKPNTGTTYDTIKQVLSILRKHTPKATFYISPLNEYSPVNLCPKMDDFWTNTLTWSTQAAAEGLARRGPDLGPINQALVGSDNCHLNGAGIALVGRQLVNFFDKGISPQPNITVEDTDVGVQYGGWRGASDAAANGGTYRVSKVRNDKITFNFTGTGIIWVTREGPDLGKAEVLLDGVSKGIFDLYSATAAPNFQLTFGGLTNSTHTLTIKVLGIKNPFASAANVVVDAFIVGTTITQENASALEYDQWDGVLSAQASDGSYRASGTKNATARLTFTGTSINWVTATGPAYGQARVLIDGVAKEKVDLYSIAAAWQAVKSYTGLANTSHTLTIKVLGTKNAASAGTLVVVDAFTGPIALMGGFFAGNPGIEEGAMTMLASPP